MLLEGARRLAPLARDTLLKAIGRPREFLPGFDLVFKNPPPHYDTSRDLIRFAGEVLGSPVACAISREALDDHFGASGFEKGGRIEAFLENRSRIERLTRRKYLSLPVEDPEVVLLTTTDVERLAPGVT